MIVRNLRRDANDAVKKAEKAKEITEDEAKKGTDDIQKMTDKIIKESIISWLIKKRKLWRSDADT